MHPKRRAAHRFRPPGADPGRRRQAHPRGTRTHPPRLPRADPKRRRRHRGTRAHPKRRPRADPKWRRRPKRGTRTHPLRLPRADPKRRPAHRFRPPGADPGRRWQQRRPRGTRTHRRGPPRADPKRRPAPRFRPPGADPERRWQHVVIAGRGRIGAVRRERLRLRRDGVRHVRRADRRQLQQLAHPADHLARLERFDEHLVAADRAAPRLVERLERPGQQDDRDPGARRIAPHERSDLVAVLARHADVGQHDVGLVPRDRFDGAGAVADRHDVDVLVRERQLDHALDRGAVVGQQQRVGHVRGSLPAGPATVKNRAPAVARRPARAS